MTIGIVAVASLATRVDVPPAVTMTSTLETHEIGRKGRKAVEVFFCISKLNNDVFPFHIAKLAQTLPKRLGARRDD